MTHADIQKLQTVTKEEQNARSQYILLDNGEEAWNQLRNTSERVDFILDNGMQLDSILSNALITRISAGFEVSVCCQAYRLSLISI